MTATPSVAVNRFQGSRTTEVEPAPKQCGRNVPRRRCSVEAGNLGACCRDVGGWSEVPSVITAVGLLLSAQTCSRRCRHPFLTWRYTRVRCCGARSTLSSNPSWSPLLSPSSSTPSIGPACQLGSRDRARSSHRHRPDDRMQ